jgi:hypothetical protein
MPPAALDLWTPRFTVDRLHPHFRGMAADPSSRACIERWADGFPDTDGKIVQEFQTRFSPAFWELYLFAMFRSLGFGVSRPKDRPDFILDTPGGRVAAEAKVTEAGPGQVPEWTPKQDVPYEKEAFYAQTTAKLAGAVKCKAEAYRKYAEEPQVKGLPFVLCLGPYDHPWFVNQHARAIWRVLYQYDQPTGEVTDSGWLRETGHRRVESFTTPSGATVPLGFFLSPENADVSAVLFNPRATTGKFFADPLRENKPGERVFACWYMVDSGTLVPQDVHPSHYRETLADGGYLLLNPFASRSIDPEPFFRQGMTVCIFDPAARTMTSRTPKPFLFERVTLGVIPDEFPSDLLLQRPRGLD